jgi:uncharacterized pyridoxamine 5'-phosphate oxidase family protein
MRETAEDLVRVQRLLDESYERAGAHLRDIITPECRLSARELCDELKGMTLLSLATVNADCEPFVSPVDGHFYRGMFWFGSAENSVRFRHIRANPAVSATHFRGEELVVTVHGRAVELDKKSGEHDGFKEVLRQVYGGDWDSSDFWETAPYAYIEPRTMFAALFTRRAMS